MPAVAVMQRMALGMVVTIRRKTRFLTVVTDNPKKGEADNNRHGFLCLYHSVEFWNVVVWRTFPLWKACMGL